MKFEQDRSVQADTLPLPESPAEVETDQSEAEDLSISGLEDKSETELTSELDHLIEDCRNHLEDIERNTETSTDRKFLVCLVGIPVSVICNLYHVDRLTEPQTLLYNHCSSPSWELLPTL